MWVYRDADTGSVFRRERRGWREWFRVVVHDVEITRGYVEGLPWAYRKGYRIPRTLLWKYWHILLWPFAMGQWHLRGFYFELAWLAYWHGHLPGVKECDYLGYWWPLRLRRRMR